MTLVKRSFNRITFGPLLSEEVVRTINIPTTKKAMDDQMNNFVAIFCIVLSLSLLQAVNNVRTIIQRQDRYTYIPDLRSFSKDPAVSPIT